MKIQLVLAFALAGLPAAPSLAQEPQGSPAPRRFDDIRATIPIPDQWHVRRDEEEGVVVYQITREEVVEPGGAFQAGLTLSVTPDVPGRTGLPPSKYAAELLAFAAEEGGEEKTTDSPPFKVL
ncbi:MAG: hypothetical protein N2322_02405, partial [Terrimicrobiaceae bacterium]|nr:hypothetical protein [Terrimicrobiaceae bacterium]